MNSDDLKLKFNRRFVGLERFGTLSAWSLVFCYVVTIIVAAMAGYFMLQAPLSWLDSIIIFALMVLIATRFRGLNNIVHECSHSTFCDNRNQNVVIGKFCASLTLSSFMKYKRDHLTHHAHLGDHDLDRDFQNIASFRLDEKLNRTVVMRHFITPLIGRHLNHYTSIDLTDDDGMFFKWFRVSLVFLSVSLTAAEPAFGGLMILIPFLFIYSSLNYWADCIDHAGLICSDDEIRASRNVFLPRVIRWIFFPRNDSYHLVHHLFPSIPARHLPNAHEILLTDEVYASMRNASGRGRSSSTPKGVTTVVEAV